MKALLSVVLLLAFGAGVWGITPEEIARWKEVYTKNKEAAENGDAEAQATIGSLYSHGLGVPEDDKEAFKWYKKAAEQGLAEAQNDLGLKAPLVLLTALVIASAHQTLSGDTFGSGHTRSPTTKPPLRAIQVLSVRC